MKQSPEFYSAVIPINPNGEVLLGKRLEDGKYTTPAGGAEPGESPIKTAIRELFEEAYIVAQPEDLIPLGPIECKNGKICYRYLLRFYGMNVSSKLDPDKEVKTWKWCSVDNLPEGLRADQNRFNSVLEAYKKYHGINKSITDLMDKLEKGGEGSGKKGHTTFHPNESKHSEMLETSEEGSVYEKEMQKLTNGSILEGVQLKSEKPVFLNVHAATAHGYTIEDYNEAGNLFYEKAKAIGDKAQQMRDIKKVPPPEMMKIRDFHLKQARNFSNMAEKVHNRQIDTKKVVREQSKKRAGLVKKSEVHMGHQDAATIDTAKFSQENQASMDSYLYERISNIMAGFEYGDEPRIVGLDAGSELHLVKVEDGLYTGVCKKATQVEGGELLDNAKVRLERMTIPAIVQFCIAKQWANAKTDVIQPVPPPVEAIQHLNVVLSDPAPPQVESELDKKIRMLELLYKLTS